MLLVRLSSKLASSTLNNALGRVGDLRNTSNLTEHLVCASLLGQDLKIGVYASCKHQYTQARFDLPQLANQIDPISVRQEDIDKCDVDLPR